MREGNGTGYFSEEGGRKRRGGWLAVMDGVVMVGEWRARWRLTRPHIESSLSPFHNTDSMIEERGMTMEYINRTRIGHRVLTWLTLVVLAGCAPTLVDTIQEY